MYQEGFYSLGVNNHCQVIKEVEKVHCNIQYICAGPIQPVSITKHSSIPDIFTLPKPLQRLQSLLSSGINDEKNQNNIVDAVAIRNT